MRRAGFRYVFLGIENVLDDDLAFLKAAAKNARREHGRTVGNATIDGHRASASPRPVRRRRPDRRQPRRHARVDRGQPGVRPPVRGLAVHPASDAVSAHADDRRVPATRSSSWTRTSTHYDGTTAVVRTEHLPAEEIEFLRWRAERWMKLRHMPAAMRHSPGFVLRHGLAMLAHTFTGTTLRSIARPRKRADGVRAVPRAAAAGAHAGAQLVAPALSLQPVTWIRVE